MKNLFYIILPALLLIVISCSDKTNLEEDTTEYKFQKELTINDGNGNSVDLLIQANSEEAIADHTTDVLYLNTTTKEFQKSSNPVAQDQSSEEIDYAEENEVFLMITSSNLNPEVTGFSVRSKLEANDPNAIQTRASTTVYYYAYGSSGTTGAWAEYSGQTCDQEYMTIKLSKKNSSISIFWNKLDFEKIYNPGNDWSYSSGTSYYKYKLRLRAKNQCSGTAYYDYYWIS